MFCSANVAVRTFVIIWTELSKVVDAKCDEYFFLSARKEIKRFYSIYVYML